ncbi:ACT domain-containing protein [Candidatus Poribacteria bacterium]
MNRSGERFILTVVGEDHPGIIAGIAGTLYEYECDIQELNQTVLSDEFAMILLLQPTRETDIQELNESLEKCCEALEVMYTLRPATLASNPLPDEDECVGTPSSMDKVIITVIGADRIGIVAGVTEVLADMGINIIELTTAPSYMIHDEPQYTMIALVEVDDCIDMPVLRSSLEDCARSLSVEINVQSQEIFNAMHKI